LRKGVVRQRERKRLSYEERKEERGYEVRKEERKEERGYEVRKEERRGAKREERGHLD